MSISPKGVKREIDRGEDRKKLGMRGNSEGKEGV